MNSLKMYKEQAEALTQDHSKMKKEVNKAKIALKEKD